MSGRRESILDPYRRRRGQGSDAAASTPSTQSSDESPESARALPVRQTMLDLRFVNGDRMAVAYIDLRAMRFNPSEGIVLELATRTVTITGRRLKQVYELLTRHHISYLAEPPDGFASPTQGKPFVERITVTERAEGEHD